MPLLCLAFLGTRNVRQRIYDSIFSRSNFLGFRDWLRLLDSSSRFACQSFRGPNRHSEGREGLDEVRGGSSWLERSAWRGGGDWRVMITRRALRALSLLFRPFFFLFALWTPLRPLCSFTHILLSGTPIDAPFSPTRSTSKHLPIPTIYFSFKRSKCADMVILFFVSFGLFLMI